MPIPVPHRWFLAAGAGTYAFLGWRLRHILAEGSGRAPMTFLPVQPPPFPAEHWGGGELLIGAREGLFLRGDD